MNDLLRARLAVQHGALAVGDAYSCGYTKLSLSRVVSAGDLLRVRTGAFVDARLHAEATPEGRHGLAALAIARSFRGRHAVSHQSAVAVLGLPLLSDVLSVTHLSRRSPGDQRTAQGLRIHRHLSPGSVRMVAGVAVVHPAVAVVQAAAVAGVKAGVAAADAALAAGRVTKKDLEVALRIGRIGPGRADARTTVDLADGLSESPGESWARVLFVSLGLPTPELQVEITDERGRLVGRVDFLFRAQRTIVEFDGLVKYGGAQGRQALIAEKRREDSLRALGYQMVRLTWRDLYDPPRLAHTMRSVLACAAA
ncbi:MAG: hypothetical protein H7269_08440 [Cellulomonas sp.]|nr:hypothetical protein [Cellulomonas sp.]